MSEQSFTPGKLVLKRAAFRPTMFVMREDYTSDEAAVAEVIDKRYAPVFAAAPALLEALTAVHALVSEGAAIGFNPHDGDWAERLFLSQRQTYAAISQAEGRDHG